jgi:outer membrane lipoprotein carrier protein
LKSETKSVSMKKLLLFTLAVVLVAGVDLYAQNDDKAKKILDEMSATYKDIPAFNANFVNRLENKVEGLDEDFSGEITIMGNKYHLKVGDQEIYNNGETVWTYLKESNEVNIDYYYPEDGDMSPSNIFNAYKEGYKYRFIEQKQKGSRKVNVVELQPEAGTDNFDQFIKIKLEIFDDTNTLASWQIYDKVGNVYSYTITGFNPNLKADSDMFEFDPSEYPGVEIIDLR